MKILVTGANGLLGQKLITLLEQDERVSLIATAHRALVLPLNHSKYVKLDITNQEQVERVIHENKPDVVIHTAAMTNVDQCELNQEACWLSNVTSVEYLVASCSRHSAHFIHLSTDFIFDGTHGPLDETAIPNPVNYYGKSKLGAEIYIQQHSPSWCILRTVLVYGVSSDMSRSNIVLWVKNSLEAGKSIQVVNDQWRTPTLAEDLAKGCILAATKKARGIYHISGKDFLTPYAMAIQTADYFNLPASLITKTDSTLFKQPAVRPLKTGFVIDKAITELGFSPVSFQEGLAVVASQL